MVPIPSPSSSNTKQPMQVTTNQRQQRIPTYYYSNRNIHLYNTNDGNNNNNNNDRNSHPINAASTTATTTTSIESPIVDTDVHTSTTNEFQSITIDNNDDDPLLLKKIESIPVTIPLKTKANGDSSETDSTPTTDVVTTDNDDNDAAAAAASELLVQVPLPESPPLSYPKFLTMQERRVVITVRYTQDSGLKPYFLTVAKKIKASHPDVIIERKVLPKEKKGDDDGESAIFEVCVDTKVIVGRRYNNRRSTRGSLGRVDMSSSSSRRSTIFVSMQELDVAISRARRKRRPTTTYGDVSVPGNLVGTISTTRRTINNPNNKPTNNRKQHP